MQQFEVPIKVPVDPEANTTDLLVITRDASTGNLVNWFFYLTLN